MENLGKVYGLNKSIDKLREQMIHLMFNDSQRCLDLDSKVLIKIGKIRTEYDGLARQRNGEIKQAYAYETIKPRTAPQKVEQIPVQKVEQIPVLIILEKTKLKVTTMIIGKNSATFNMTPSWFKPDDDTEVLKTIKYPPNIDDKRPFNTVARFRAAQKETLGSNDFNSKPIEVKEDATETLILALDVFVQQFGGKLSFTNEDLSFDDSAHHAACGVADLGSAHLLASEHVPSAKFALIVNLDYDNLAKSKETMQDFLLSFTEAVAQDLSCDNGYVRVTSVEKSTKGKGKAEVNLVLTTPDKTKTEELADTLKDHARSGFSNKTILGYIKPDEYQCKWMPILSYLQLQPLDFDPQYNLDYTIGMPEQLTRGGCPYYLPIGWYRHALRVHNKYTGSAAWLGSNNGPGEWPVAFHGTNSKAVKSIADEGLLVSAVKTDVKLQEAINQKGEEVNRPGLYVATHCNGGSHPNYTIQFDVLTPPNTTDTLQVVFQCRVRPDSFTRHTSPVKVGEAWRIVDPTAVRPYGILLKNINTKVPYE